MSLYFQVFKVSRKRIAFFLVLMIRCCPYFYHRIIAVSIEENNLQLIDLTGKFGRIKDGDFSG